MDAPRIKALTNKELKKLILSDPHLSSSIRKSSGLPLLEETKEIMELKSRYSVMKLEDSPLAYSKSTIHIEK